MTPSRRHFVTTLAAVPFLTLGASAQRRPPGAPADPVLEQILEDLRAQAAEFEAQTGSKKTAMRAMEATLGIGAAHLAANYDTEFRQALRRGLARSGRAALIDDVITHARKAGSQNVTHETIDAAMTRYEQVGLSGCFRDMQRTIRRVRLQAPDQIQAARAAAIQWDYCSDLNWMISNLEGLVNVVCAIAILEPTWGGEIPCAALILCLGLLQLQRSWFC